MEPEILLRERAQVRRVFTRTANKTTHTEVDFDYLAEKAEMLAKLDRDIHDAMLSSENYDEAKFTTEYDECEAYQTRWRMLKKEISKPEDRRDFSYSYNKKLPKIELRQFDDNPKTWLSFWTQFKKIHEDKTMDEEDKFYYLIQAMAEGSNSKTIATSYPVTKENYYKVLETLKARYAKDEVLIEIYVRELLKLVMTKSNFALEVLYDKIIVNLQVLESLGITKDKYQCILLPLIESALPDATLNLWSKVKLTSESKLSQLLVFLNTEVESEARCKLARGTFTENAGCDAVPTAACLVSTKQVNEKLASNNQREGKELCYFCDRGHNTLECGKTNSISLEERKEAIKKKGGCYICLKKGHMAKMCKAYIKCILCNRRHLIILCPNLKTCEQKPDFNNDKKSEKTEVASNFTSNNKTTLLQTLVVKVSGNIQERKVRALLDAGAQRTYIKAGLAEELGLEVTGSESLGHSLFGGIKKTAQIHRLIQLQIAIPTKLGWTLQGPIQGVYNTTVNTHFVTSMPEDSLEFMWNLETLGIKDPCEKKDLSESEIMKNFINNISVKEGRYEVELLWKEDRPELESNYEQAYRRLLSTTKKLESLGKLQGYHEVFEEWKKEGIIEMVEEQKTYEGHYLPHHAVYKLESATTKIRPVFDASCRDKNKYSLNACIEKGVNLIEAIPKLLTMFRAGAYGIISDIRKAFLQIAVSSSDRKYLKLLWWKDPKNKEEVVTYQHTRVPFGVACSPFLLAATINYHLEKHAEYYPDTAIRLRESFYVDNCVTSFDSENDLDRFRKEAIKLIEIGKFELRGWMTNSKKEEDPVSVLGIQWNRQKDDLGCIINVKAVQTSMTKRDLLSVTQQIFDPIGFLCPVTLIPKLIIQKAWILKTGWGEKVPTELEKEYKNWISTIDFVNQIKIPRRLTDHPLEDCKVSLHVFCDASKDAYAGCVFLRTEHEEKVIVRLIIAKSRVTPIKRQMTLPRLELMGAVIASRLYLEVMTSGLLSSCKDYKVYCWTDSTVVLAWLKRQETWKTFVTNRVQEICTNTDKDSWSHLPGFYNPADLPSRGCDGRTLIGTQWWAGPQWMYLKEHEWPKSITTRTNNEEEVISSEQRRITNVHVEINTENFSDRLLYFNQYTKIVRLVARLLRMSPRIRNKYNITSEHIGYEEYKNAEETIIKIIQSETYKNEKNKDKKLITMEEDGVLKVKTRLEYSKEDRDFIFPILLPGKSVLVQRMVHHKHIEMKHAGSQTMMTLLRNTYWITSIRKLTKKVVSQCITCKRFKAKHYEAPQPPLPSDRICNTAAFEVSGIDLAGPLFLKNNQKCWIVLFTCAVYRAIHLELTESVSTASFMMTLRRFISRRGRPRIIYTDNGTNFVGTANLLQEIDWQEVEDTTNSYNIHWKFSVPAAPWWGGWWERLVRVVKEMLRRILGKASIGWIELSTILCDCEAVINNRPLTYVEMGDMRPLTPMMFLQGLPSNGTSDLDQIDHENLNIRYKYLQQLREDFRKRFKCEYLGLLISKGKENRNEPKVGDIVLIETDSKRLHWPIGLVKEIFTGKDGYTRAARVQTATGEKVRPYQRLYPLEISASSSEWLNNLPRCRGVPHLGQQQPETEGENNSTQVAPMSIPLTTSRSGRTTKLPLRLLD